MKERDIKNRPDDIAPKIKYFKPPSLLFMEDLLPEIKINKLKVCNSKAK